MFKIKENIKQLLPLTAWAILILLIIITHLVLTSGTFLFDDFKGTFREPRWANGLLMKYNSNIEYQNKNCSNKTKIAVVGNSVFWEGTLPENSIVGYMTESLKDQYCILNFTSIGTSIVNWYSQINFINSNYKPDIIIVPVMYSQMIRGSDKIGIEEVTKFTLETLDIKSFLFMNTNFSYYTSGVRLNPIALIEEYLPVLKYKNDIIYEINQLIWKDATSVCSNKKCATSIHQILYNFIQQKKQEDREVIVQEDVNKKDQETDLVKSESIQLNENEPQKLSDQTNTPCKSPKDVNVKNHFQGVMNNFFKLMHNRNLFWYFYRELIKENKSKVLFVTTPINYDGFKEECIEYDSDILKTKLTDFLPETDQVAILDHFYDPNLNSSFFKDYAHLNTAGSEYFANLIINKIIELKW